MPVNALPTSPIELREVSSLHHKAPYHSVEDGALEVQLLAIAGRLLTLSGAQLSEILSCLRYDVLEELHGHSSRWFATDLKVEEDPRVLRVRCLLHLIVYLNIRNLSFSPK